MAGVHSNRLLREQVFSAELQADREVLTWLPPTFSATATERFPLIVSLDGAKALDINGLSLNDAVLSLAGEGVMPRAIVAAVCPGSGDAESRALDLSLEHGGAAFSRFLTRDLLAHIERRYRVLPDQSARILCGTGLGGLNGLATMLREPGVFGKAVMLSASFEDVSGAPPAHSELLREIERSEQLPKGVRIFMDYGTEGLDECYDPYYRELRGLLVERGWREGVEFLIRRVPGGRHDMASWRERLADGLRFVARGR